MSKTKRPTKTIEPAVRTSRILFAGLAVYLAILVAMVSLDSYGFILKSAVIPFLLLAAVLSGRFTGFVNDWALFLGAVVLFDSFRSLDYSLITHFELPMYANYAIDWERHLCGGGIAPVGLQRLRATLAQPRPLDRLFVLLHASHFLVFLLFGFVLWIWRRAVFRTYALAMLAVLYAGLLIQFAVPTLPPWLAARELLLLPPIERIVSSVYNVHLPTIAAMFDVNPIAAMPSLHAAMPVLCALFAVRYFGWPGAVVVAYAAGVCVAALYLGEHYLVDVVAGIALAAAVFVGVCRWGAAPSGLDGIEKVDAHERLAPRRVAVALAMVGFAFACGQLAKGWLGPLPITRAFVERELVGRSPMSHYLLGRIALTEGSHSEARIEMTKSLDELTDPKLVEAIRTMMEKIPD